MKKSSQDTRRTLPPPNAAISLLSDGFEVACGHDEIATVSWSGVKAVFAYTRFRNGDCNLCLAFSLASSKKDDQVVVSDNLQGWGALVARLDLALPGVDSNWIEKAQCDTASTLPVAAVVPSYVANPTQVWPANHGA